LIDGEAIVCDENGLADFELIRGHGTAADAVHCAFWLKVKNSNAPAVKREAEEDWGNRRSSNGVINGRTRSQQGVE
jgi:hypothetical protein